MLISKLCLEVIVFLTFDFTAFVPYLYQSRVIYVLVSCPFISHVSAHSAFQDIFGKHEVLQFLTDKNHAMCLAMTLLVPLTSTTSMLEEELELLLE